MTQKQIEILCRHTHLLQQSCLNTKGLQIRYESKMQLYVAYKKHMLAIRRIRLRNHRTDGRKQSM